MQEPLSDASELERTQQAVAVLGECEEMLRSVLGRSAWLQMDHYAETPEPALDYPNRLFRWLDAWWMRGMRHSVYAPVLSHLALLQSLLRKLESFVGELEGSYAPPLLREWGERVRAITTSPAFVDIAAEPLIHLRRPPAVLRADAALREDRFEALTALVELVYELDALHALALATRRHGLSIPEFVTEGTPFIRGEGVYHPLLEAPLANRVEVTPERRLLFITGPNRAGKSTYLKSLGIAVYMAHLGMGVPAASLRLSVFSFLFAGIDGTDNLRLGESYFLREVRKVGAAARLLARDGAGLVIFDEMFKGTNVRDACDASLAVLTAFAGCERSACVVASHLTELTAPLGETPGVVFARFDAELEGDELRFPFRMEEGVSEQRLGARILEQQGVIEELERLRSTSGRRARECERTPERAAALEDVHFAGSQLERDEIARSITVCHERPLTDLP